MNNIVKSSDLLVFFVLFFVCSVKTVFIFRFLCLKTVDKSQLFWSNKSLLAVKGRDIRVNVKMFYIFLLAAAYLSKLKSYLL